VEAGLGSDADAEDGENAGDGVEGDAEGAEHAEDLQHAAGEGDNDQQRHPGVEQQREHRDADPGEGGDQRHPHALAQPQVLLPEDKRNARRVVGQAALLEARAHFAHLTDHARQRLCAVQLVQVERHLRVVQRLRLGDLELVVGRCVVPLLRLRTKIRLKS